MVSRSRSVSHRHPGTGNPISLCARVHKGLVVLFVALGVLVGSRGTPDLRADDGLVHPSAGVRANQWTVVEVTGVARYRTGHNSWNHWRKVVVGAVLLPGAQLETEAGGRIVLAHGGDRITTSANSSMEIPVPEPDSMVTQIVQTFGSIFYSVETRPMAYVGDSGAKVTGASLTQNGGRNWTPMFVVQTPYLIAGVKGTAFGVSVDRENEAAAVAVAEGTVAVDTDNDLGDGQDVSAGQTAATDSASNGSVSVSETGRSASSAASSKAAKSAAAAAKNAASSGKDKSAKSRSVAESKSAKSVDVASANAAAGKGKGGKGGKGGEGGKGGKGGKSGRGDRGGGDAGGGGGGNGLK